MGGWGVAAGRGVLIATAGLLVALPLSRLLLDGRNRIRHLAWILVLLPFLTPALLIGYAYATHSCVALLDPTGKEILYMVLLCMRVTPVGAMALALLPRPLTPEACFCYKLAAKRNRCRCMRSIPAHLLFGLQGPALPRVTAGTLLFLLAFGEFEMASLLGIKTWTVTLFDAQTGGLPLGESFRLVKIPLLVEGTSLLLLFGLVLRKLCRSEEGSRPEEGPRSGIQSILLWSYLALSLALLVAVPGFLVLIDLIKGLALLGSSFTLWKEVAASVLLGGSTAILAFLLAASATRKKKISVALLGILSLPGLLGPLVLGLAVLSLFQASFLSRVYDTPIPLLLALTLLLLPFALVLRLALIASTPAECVHLAVLLRRGASFNIRRSSRDLLWKLKTRKFALVIFLLFCWGYFDLTASALLAPSDMTPVHVRLYNFMHYGRSAVLSAMVAVVTLLPVFLALLGVGAWRLLERMKPHG